MPLKQDSRESFNSITADRRSWINSHSYVCVCIYIYINQAYIYLQPPYKYILCLSQCMCYFLGYMIHNIWYSSGNYDSQFRYSFSVILKTVWSFKMVKYYRSSSDKIEIIKLLLQRLNGFLCVYISIKPFYLPSFLPYIYILCLYQCLCWWTDLTRLF